MVTVSHISLLRSPTNSVGVGAGFLQGKVFGSLLGFVGIYPRAVGSSSSVFRSLRQQRALGTGILVSSADETLQGHVTKQGTAACAAGGKVKGAALA